MRGARAGAGCVGQGLRYKSGSVKGYLGFVVCAGLLPGCGAAEKVAVTSYRVATAPVRLVTRPFASRPEEDSAARSDVDTPGRPVAAATPRPRPQTAVNSPPARSRPAAAATPKPRSSPSTSAEFPTAKPVPGKPGYVFSPFDPSGGYVDVTGYTSGQKVKDPYSGKVFLVP